MKTLIFLILMALAVFAMIWTTKKSHARESLERHKALERRKKERQEALKQDYVTWPVIIRPVTGGNAAVSGSEAGHAHELAMPTIEYEAPEQKSA